VPLLLGLQLQAQPLLQQMLALALPLLRTSLLLM
jgi:hypothetical protein